MLQLSRTTNRIMAGLALLAGLTLLAIAAIAQPPGPEDHRERPEGCDGRHGPAADRGYGPPRHGGGDHRMPPPPRFESSRFERGGSYPPPPPRDDYGRRGRPDRFGPPPREYGNDERFGQYGPPPPPPPGGPGGRYAAYGYEGPREHYGPPPQHARFPNDRGREFERGWRDDRGGPPQRREAPAGPGPELTFDELDVDGNGVLSRKEASLIVRVDQLDRPAEDRPIAPQARD